MAFSVLESVMDPGRDHDLCISHVGAAASSTEKSELGKRNTAGRGLEDPLSQVLCRETDRGPEREGLP